MDTITSELFRFERALPNGWSLNMFAVRLPGGGTLVHSPTWMGEGTFDEVEKAGEPRVLFAPNHYHHLSLERYRKRYPRALAVANESAIPRLLKKGHVGVQDLVATRDLLPPGARWLRCGGAKNGEAWLSLPGDGGPTWIVCDAFFNPTRPVTGFMGFATRALKIGPGLSIGTTFKLVGIEKAADYREWALRAVDEEKPRRVLFSHGEAIEGEGVPARLSELIRARV
jgi:hypothetical protein